MLRLLAVVATNRGATEEGLTLLDAAREEHRHINDREGEAMVIGQRGALLMNWGRLEEARTASEEALEVFQATGHRYREGVMLTNLARIAMEQGRLDDALEGGRRALHLTEEIDDAEGVAASLQSLGDGHRLAGDHQTAREYLERGLEESRQHKLPYFTAHLLASLAAVDLADGRLDEAIEHATEAQQAAAADDVPHAQARADLLAGMVRQDVGDPAAVGLLRAVAAKHAELGVEADWLESLSVLALALEDAGDLARRDGGGRGDPAGAGAVGRSGRRPAGPGPGRRPPGAGARRRPARRGRRPPGRRLPPRPGRRRSATTTCGTRFLARR